MSTTTCWSCGKDRAPTDALCPPCGKVQPQAPGTTAGLLDKFAVLGLPRNYAQDLAKVGEAFRGLSRKLHPDRFARASPRERRFSLEQTTQLNDAYRVVKDPVRRAEHLLELRGVKLAREERGEALPLEFLEQAMEDREKLLEAKMEGGPAAVEALAAGVRAKRDESMREIAQILEGPADSAAAHARAAELLSRLHYYLRYLDEVEGREPEI
jgi:molecular chaperone HscB